MWKEREEGAYRRRGAKELERDEGGEVRKAEGTVQMRIWHQWVREKKGGLKPL
jgi:hypothetical protein